MQVGQGSMTCVGMATNCTVNLNNNTEEASTKDDIGMASKPTVVSKSWSVQVDSLKVTDAGSLLTNIKNMALFTLIWDETSTTNNQSQELAEFCRTGKAYLNDATFQFDNRTNAAKSLQFTGVSALETVSTSGASTYTPSDTYTKGQFVRLFLSSDNTATPSKVIAAARQLSLHISLSMEDSTTKDTTGDWQVQEPTGYSYDISTTALVRSGETITSAVDAQGLSEIEAIYEAGTPVKWQIANVSGDNNRTKGTVIASGSCILSLSVSAQNKADATYTANMQGYGEMTVGS